MFDRFGKIAGCLCILILSGSARAEPEMKVGEPITIHRGALETFEEMASRSERSPVGKFARQSELWNPPEPITKEDLSYLNGEEAADGQKAFPNPSGTPVMKPNLIFDAGGMANGWPPDTNGAAGPNHVMILLNFAARIYDRQGNQISTASLDSLFNLTYNGTNYPKAGTFDPRIVYDVRTERWIAVALDFGDSYVVNGTTRRHLNYTMLAISTSDDPTKGWYKYLINSTVSPVTTNGTTVRYFTDYPTLGVDDNGIYLGYRVFPSSGSSFALLIAAHKDQFLAGSSTLTGGKWSNITDMYSAPYPCIVTTGVASDDAQFFISTNPDIESNKLNYRRVKWNGTTPTLSGSAMTFTVDKVKDMVNAPSLGSTTNINTGDRRISSAPIRRGAEIILTRSVGMDSTGDNGTVSRTGQELHRVRVYTAAGGGHKADRQTLGSLDRDRVFSTSSTPHYFHHGSAAMNGRDHYVAAFAASRSTAYVGVAYTSAKKDSHVRVPTLYSTGTHKYTRLDSANTPRNRWGDYTSTFADPNNDSSIWSFQQRAGNSDHNFRIVAARFDMPSPWIIGTNFKVVQMGSTIDLSILGDYFHYNPGSRIPPVEVALLLPAIQHVIIPDEVEVINEQHIRIRVNIPRGDELDGAPIHVRVRNMDGQETILEDALEITGPTAETPTPIPTPTATPTPTPEPPGPEPEPVTSGDVCSTQQGLAGILGAKARGTRLAPEITSSPCASSGQDSAVAFSFYVSQTATISLSAQIPPNSGDVQENEPGGPDESVVALSVRRCCSEADSEIFCDSNQTNVAFQMVDIEPGFYTVLVETEGEKLIVLEYESSVPLEPLVYTQCPTGATPTPRPTPTPVPAPRDPCEWTQGLSGTEGAVGHRMFEPIAEFESAPCLDPADRGFVASFCFRVPENGANVMFLGSAFLINSDSTSDFDGDEDIQGVDVTEGYNVAFSLRSDCGGANSVLQCETGIQEEDILIEGFLPAGFYTLTGEALYNSGFRVTYTSDVPLDGSCATRLQSWLLN